MLDVYGIQCAEVRAVLRDYLLERAPAVDHTTLRGLAQTLGRLFWRDLELHHPGICSFSLAPEVAAAWKQRVLVKTTRTVDADGRSTEAQHLRSDGRAQLGQVRAFYLDIAQWAMEEPVRWGRWAAPCPIRQEDLGRMQEIRRRKSRMDQRTRERLPALPALVARVHTRARVGAERLRAAQAVGHGEQFTCQGQILHRAPLRSGSTAKIWSEDPVTGARRDLTGEEDRAFWTWAAIETLRHTGIRVEELTELSHHSLVQYTPPTSTERIPLLQIAPSKTDTDRLLGTGSGDTDLTSSAGQPLRFTPHDFRRIFITDAVLDGMPPHIAQLVAGHRDINTTMGYKAVYPDEVINGHRAFIARRRALRPGEEYRQPTDKEWDEFLGHFERRKVALGTCGRSYATPCIHEHSCLRCPLLRPDPAERGRLTQIRDNLLIASVKPKQTAGSARPKD